MHAQGFSVQGLLSQGTRPSGWSAAALVASLVDRFKFARSVHAQRRLLAEMDDRMLADIGVSRAQASAEAARGFWDLTPRRH